MRITHQLGQTGRTLRLSDGLGGIGGGDWSEEWMTYLIDFEGCGDVLAIEDYYDGGAGGPSKDFDVYFINALSVIDSDASGSGNIANEPSPDTAMFYIDEPASMNSETGFGFGMSFYYSMSEYEVGASPYESYARFYTGVNGTGDLVTVNFNVENSGLGWQTGTVVTFTNLGFEAGGGDPTGNFQRWARVQVTWPGTVKSVVFEAASNFVAFDDVSFGRE